MTLTIDNDVVEHMANTIYSKEIVTGRVEHGWLRIRAVTFVIIYINLMRNHTFKTLTVAISRQPNYP